MDTLTELTAISPLDGRYRAKIGVLTGTFSEFALIKHRLQVEVAWFIALAEWPLIAELRPLSADELGLLRSVVDNFDLAEAEAVKSIERTTNHDVKAVEYYLKRQLEGTSLAAQREFVHFACTSADINNLAYALMLKQGVGKIWADAARQVVGIINALAQQYQAVPMLAHTHGQPASPTTVGKELAVFSHRLKRQLAHIEQQEYLGKINGAVGNFNAHSLAYPEADWPGFAQKFVEQKLGLTYNPLTTQIEAHDFMAELFQAIIRFNAITIDLARDMWLYISKGYFTQRVVAGEVGSSTMPHKVNPIDFENAEGNMGVSNALLGFMAQKLPVSRWQRDLSDSTVLRNVGSGVGHSLLALQSIEKGLRKLSLNEEALHADLATAWDVLAEPVQTIMRKAGLDNPYEKLKAMTRGQAITAAQLKAFVQTLPISQVDKARLLDLSPETYIGLAAVLASEESRHTDSR